MDLPIWQECCYYMVESNIYAYNPLVLREESNATAHYESKFPVSDHMGVKFISH